MMIDRDLWAASRLSDRRLLLLTLHVTIGASHLPQALMLSIALAGAVTGQLADTVRGAAVVVLVAAARSGLMIWRARVAADHGEQVRRALRERALRRSLAAGGVHNPTRRVGATRLTVTDGVEGVDAYVTGYIPAVVAVVVLCPVTVVVLAVLSPWVGLAAAGAVLVSLTAPMIWRRTLAARSWTHWDTFESLASDYQEALRGMKTLRTLGATPQARERIQGRSDELHRATVSTMRVSLVDTAFIDVAVQGGTVAAALLAAWDAAHGQEPAVATYLVLLLAGEAFRPVRDLAAAWHAGYRGVSAVAGLRGLDAFTPPAVEPGAAAGAPAPVSSATELVVSDVRAGYTDDVLTGVTFTAPAGGLTVVVGESGTGKSTLLDVLLGLLPVRTGHITLDGERLDPRVIATVAQRPLLLDGTIGENIRLARPDVSEAQVWEAVDAVGLRTDLSHMPARLDTPVGESGRALSGGQRQRVALARALLSGRPLLLVDEPTASLDAETGADVATTLAEVARDRIVVVVTHDDTVVRAASRVFRLRDGRLTRGDGAHV